MILYMYWGITFLGISSGSLKSRDASSECAFSEICSSGLMWLEIALSRDKYGDIR